MKKHTVLIVDDDRENLNLLGHVLEGDYHLHKARSGSAALRILRRVDVDAVLTDQRMPGMTGVEFLEKARGLRPDCVRILITAYPDANNAIQAINRGQVKRYIAKPFDPGELRVILAQEVEHLDLILANRRLNQDMERMVDDLFRANRELQNLNLMKDRFLADCSHELKTPLASALGYLELMGEGRMGAVEGRQRKGLEIAQRNLRRLLAMIENLLALSRARFRPGESKRRRFDLGPLIEECVQSLRARARKESLEVRVRRPRGPLWVEGSEREIHSVITNVLSNAEKFTPLRARIGIDARKGREGRWHVSVTDNGPGPERPGEEIRSFRTSSDPRTAGLGIGLAIAREILQRHGGKIRIERGVRGGAIVRFDLPPARG